MTSASLSMRLRMGTVRIRGGRRDIDGFGDLLHFLLIKKADHVFIAGHQACELPAREAVHKTETEEEHIYESPEGPAWKLGPDFSANPLAHRQGICEKGL